MRTIKLFMAAMVFAAFGNLLIAGNGGPGDDTKATTMSMDELKACYGENIVFEGNLDEAQLEGMQITLLAGPCDAYPEFGLCGPVAAQARIVARNIANSCCCTVVYGYECCDPQFGGPIAVLFVTEPTGNCGLGL